jgi:hypothetical protein
MQRRETIIEKAQTYWETLKHGDTIDAEQLFDVVKGKTDLNQAISYARSFLTRKFNDGFAFLITGQSPPTYRKLEIQPSIIDYCIMTFNSLPMNEKLTTISFKNRLPLKYQGKYRSIQNFLHRAKISGSLVNMRNDNGKVISRGKVVTACKKASIIKLPLMGKIGRQQTQLPIPEDVKTVSKMTPEEMASKIFDMKVSDAGIAIFETIYKLMEENENQGATIKTLNKGLDDMLRKNKDLHISNKKLEETILEYKKKDKTFAELHGQKGQK